MNIQDPSISKSQATLPKVTIYTDGACSGNPGPGGWGALLQFHGASVELDPNALKNWYNKKKLNMLDICENSTKFRDSLPLKQKSIFGHELYTTNNQMEMTAVIEALKVLKKSCYVEVYTDSKYLQLGITQWINTWIKNNWHKNNNDPVKNVDLWKKLYEELSKHYIIWNWVKGHNNNEGNEVADRLAVQGKETAIKILKCHS
ncbi:ribonuclease HI [Candidatus Tisiphia endosymbiont of Metellina segmentata]|uniref:ribonuclease H family protein n=1 Tax=Candidatus Tisiphia endosymbiont of Metellina segmentata TaxID=3066274 RepID=UPI00313B5165|nr:ribonuclease HI [Rickettsiaceae bacterium]MDD9338056.1 ribonuclease HI [Rickettsiaceae bacterium]